MRGRRLFAIPAMVAGTLIIGPEPSRWPSNWPTRRAKPENDLRSYGEQTNLHAPLQFQFLPLQQARNPTQNGGQTVGLRVFRMTLCTVHTTKEEQVDHPRLGATVNCTLWPSHLNQEGHGPFSEGH